MAEKSSGVDLVVGFVRDVLGHVSMEKLQGLCVSGIPAGESAEFVILSTAEFRILSPKVFLNLLEGLQELENCNVPPRDRYAIIFRPVQRKCFACEQPGAHSCCARHRS